MTHAPARDSILVVDDDPSVTGMLRRGLRFAGFSVQTAATGDEAINLVSSEQPSLVVLDVMMAGLDGFSVCRRLRMNYPGLPILMLTARDANEDELEGLEAGADDYVKKPFDFEVLAARIRSLLRRRQPKSSDTLQYGDLIIDRLGRVTRRGPHEIELTTTEFDLLVLLVSHAGQVLTKEQILERLWGHDFGGNANIVEVYVRSLRMKLESRGEHRLIQTVRGVGYVVRD